MKSSFLTWTLAMVLIRDVVGTAVRREAEVKYTGTPCAAVSVSAAAMLASSAASPTVNAQLAYDCLTSVPLDTPGAIALVNSIIPYLEWQSDTSYLKNPPLGYLEPPVDLYASFDMILKNIESGMYSNEYEFQSDLLTTFQSAHDGHFRFAPDLISKALQFRRPVQLVSVSRDGVEIPKPYVRGDIAAYTNGNWTALPSAVTKVNEVPVDQFLNQLGQLGFLQDPDALYNNLFYEMAFDAQYSSQRYTGYFALGGRYGYFYPGATTTIQFENGTTNTYQNYADVVGDFTGVIDAPSFYQKFCTGPHLQAYTANPDMVMEAPLPPPLPPTGTNPPYGYPSPRVVSSDQQISGYFLDGPGYEDVAVLSMLSFEANFAVEFQSVIQTLISDAKAAGKSKLIIDLSSNGGGNILLGYDAFRQFFPQIVQDGFSRMREHDAFKIMSKQVSEYSANFTAITNNPKDIFAYTSVLNFRFDLNQTNGSFITYEDKFAPQKFNDESFTNILRWNMNDPTTTTNAIWGIGETVTGYGTRQNFTQPFAAEDIIMVYDGYCASTCTIFSEFMRVQAGVKSIAMGGRPNTSPIQAIGGTKGANTYPFSYIYQLANVALSTGTPEQIQNWTSVTAYTDLPLNRSSDASLNVRDNILRANLEDGIPAQFVHELADCRLFYEPSMTTDVGNIWRKAADAAWGSGKCVAGSLPHQNETTAIRKRKSEDMKRRAESEGRVSIPRQNLVPLPKNPNFGKKVPW